MTREEARKYLTKGAVLRINKNVDSNLRLNDIVIFDSIYSGNEDFMNVKRENGSVYAVNHLHVDVDDVKGYEEMIKKLQNDIKVYQDRVDYMKATGKDIFNELEYTVYQTLEVIERQKMPRLKKAEVIAKLISKVK